ncbi:MAG: hypothetical protein ACK4UN_08485 [Limisphaerales bacterium]
MYNPFYQFWTYDQTQFNWLTRVIDKDGDGYGARFQFLEAFCPKCYGLDEDAVFATGWAQTFVRIRPRKERNILKTDDHFLCVRESLLRAFVQAGVRGFEHKPLPGADWHVLRVTNRRTFDPNVYRTPEAACKVCNRVAHYGSVRLEREIDLPKEELTFFSTDKPRGQGGYEIFVTDKLRELLVASGAKGGELQRLLTEEEEMLQNENPKWRPKNGVVYLGQHRHTIND